MDMILFMRAPFLACIQFQVKDHVRNALQQWIQTQKEGVLIFLYFLSSEKQNLDFNSEFLPGNPLLSGKPFYRA
jgi:hypothetical protein